MRYFHLGVALVLLAVTPACYTFPGTGPHGSSSCDFRTSTPPEQGCTDYTSVATGQSSFNTSCAAGGGTTRDRCPRDGALGGCTISNTDGLNNSQTDWYYADVAITTANDVRASCAAEGSTFVTP